MAIAQAAGALGAISKRETPDDFVLRLNAIVDRQSGQLQLKKP